MDSDNKVILGGEQQPEGTGYSYDASAPDPGAPSQGPQVSGYPPQQQQQQGGGGAYPVNPAVPQQGAYPPQAAYGGETMQQGGPAYDGGAYPPPPGAGQPAAYGGAYPQPGYPGPDPQYPPPPPTYEQQTQGNVVVIQSQPTVTHVQQPTDSGDATMGFMLALMVTVIAALCGCWWALICTVPAMVISLTSNDAARRGDYDSVRRSRNISLGLSLTAVLTSVIAVVVLVVIVIVGV